MKRIQPDCSRTYSTFNGCDRNRAPARKDQSMVMKITLRSGWLRRVMCTGKLGRGTESRARPNNRKRGGRGLDSVQTQTAANNPRERGKKEKVTGLRQFKKAENGSNSSLSNSISSCSTIKLTAAGKLADWIQHGRLRYLKILSTKPHAAAENGSISR